MNRDASPKRVGAACCHLLIRTARVRRQLADERFRAVAALES